MHDRRILIPIIAGGVLAIVATWRIATNSQQDYGDQVKAAVNARAAPGFEALDADNHLVRLGTFLGRHKIIVVFFDGEEGADADTNLFRLRVRYAELQSHNVKVVAVSSAIPQRNRVANSNVGPFPFPLVSDFDPKSPEGLLRIHRQWGRIDPETGKPRTGVFLIDRKGYVSSGVDGPIPFRTVDDAIDAALK